MCPAVDEKGGWIVYYAGQEQVFISSIRRREGKKIGKNKMEG